jgi:hypothetical protein
MQANPVLRPTIIAVAVGLVLTGCGGGGGGGSPSYQRASTNYNVPYHTPTRVGTVQPLNTTSARYDNTALFSNNLSGGTQQEVVMVGRMSPVNGQAYHEYDVQIFGWDNGSLTNKTTSWFSGTDNRIQGSESQVKFADFNGDGRNDMFIGTYTDTAVYGPMSVFINQGGRFSRTDIANVNNIAVADSAIYDINGDGRSDILALSHRSDTMIHFGRGDGTFQSYTNQSWVGGGSGVSVGDFMGTGGSSMIITDTPAGGNRLYSWTIQAGLDRLLINEITTLPTPRFLLPKWSSQGFTSSHDIRALAFDFDASGRTSAVIISRPEKNGTYPAFSEVQFLKNHGGGVFTDVTDTVLVNYDTSTPASYNPVLADVNSDGLTDIVLSSPNWDSNAGSQVLIHTSEHKYVASYAAVLKAFQDQAQDLERAVNASVINGANGVVFVQGPDGAMYLATAVTYTTNGAQQKAVYLSKLGAVTPNAQATAALVKQTWPWMSDAQVNAVLSTSSTSWFGMKLLDPSKALSPVGALSIPVAGGLRPINGSITGVNIAGSANAIKAVDSLGRDFTVNYSPTSYNSNNLWNRYTDNMDDDDTRSAQVLNMTSARYQKFKVSSSSDNSTMFMGITDMDVYKDTRLNLQFARMPFNPYVQISGSWGRVQSSTTIESTITHRQQGWVGKVGVMYTATEIEKGLVSRINPITAVWTEAGHEWSNFRVYGGTLPKVIDGSVDLTLPTSVDIQGQIRYSQVRADLISPTVGYARMSYHHDITRRSRMQINAMTTSQNQYNLSVNYKVRW